RPCEQPPPLPSSVLRRDAELLLQQPSAAVRSGAAPLPRLFSAQRPAWLALQPVSALRVRRLSVALLPAAVLPPERPFAALRLVGGFLPPRRASSSAAFCCSSTS